MKNAMLHKRDSDADDFSQRSGLIEDPSYQTQWVSKNSISSLSPEKHSKTPQNVKYQLGMQTESGSLQVRESTASDNDLVDGAAKKNETGDKKSKY